MKEAERKIKRLTWEIAGGYENALMDGEEEFKWWEDFTEDQKVEHIFEIIKHDIEKEVRFIGNENIKAFIRKWL